MSWLALLAGVGVLGWYWPPSIGCDKIGSYYTPGIGTTNLNDGVAFCTPARVTGRALPRPLLVASDVEGSVQRIEPDGRVTWRYSDSERPRSLRLRDSASAEFVSGRYRITVDVETGRVLSSRHTGTRYRCVEDDIVCEPDGVRIESSGEMIPAQNPRDAIKAGAMVYVADTFGHRVFAYDLTEKRVTFSVPVYYPADIQLIDDGHGLIVAAEHENRILRIDVKTSEKSIVAGCREGPFADPNASPSDIAAAERRGALTRADGKSICAGSMYSPNGVTRNADGTLLVADTDNHRVVWLDQAGQTLATIGPFNNPVRAIFLD